MCTDVHTTLCNQFNCIVLPLTDDAFPRLVQFETSPKDTVAITKSTVVLECVASGYPKPRITWLKDGFEISLGRSGYSILGQGNLMIEQVSVSHAGTYTCRASATTRSTDATAKLDVLCKWLCN